MDEFIVAMKAGDSAALRELIPAVELNCPAGNQVAARRSLGKLHALEGRARLAAGEPAGQVQADLDRFQPFGDHWELQRLRGDMARDAGDHQVAAEHYLRALDLIADETYTPRPPPPDEINAVHEDATLALSLAAELVEPTKRSGEPRAYYARQVRGTVVPKKNPQITFVFDQAMFDAHGERAAAELLPILRKESPSAVTVIGHTDPQGADDYNLALSRARAEAVRGFLIDNGFAGTIELRWCGERAPARINNAEKYSEDERMRINRRVEIFYDRARIADDVYAPCQN